ncbi:chaperone modulator CbpM [Desulfococcus sp.]|uniref:chaperone modulator CbpM n=1 Tax=Desulfococcus sp. TaxID=2025834 RepID=UPI003D1446BF
MKRQVNLPVLVKRIEPDRPYLRISEVAVCCRIHPGLVHRFVRLGLVDPIDTRETPERWLFESEAVPLIAKIIRLRNELGINYSGVGVVLDLLERINTLEDRIRELERGL